MKRNTSVLLILVLLICCLFLLNACGNTQSQAKANYTYDNLSDNQKRDIDFILSHMDETVTNNGYKYTCTNFSFSTGENGNSIIYYCNTSDIVLYWNYEYDAAKDYFKCIDKFNIPGAIAGGKMVYASDWSTSWDIKTKQDFLANKLLK